MLLTILSESKFIKADINKLMELILARESKLQVAVILLLSIGRFCCWFPGFTVELAQSVTGAITYVLKKHFKNSLSNTGNTQERQSWEILLKSISL